MSDWAKVELSELLTLVIDHRGKTPKKMGFDDFFSKGYPVLSAKHIKNGDLVNLDNLRYGNNEMYKKWMKEEVKKEDIILTSEAPLGETYYIDNDQKYILGQRVFGLRVNKEKVVPKYLEIWLSSLKGQQELFKRASGSTVQGIKQTELLKITVDIPPLEIQEKIATIGDSLSKKIKLNTQTNQTLEQIAQAIFKHWFIDFAPVHAKANALARGETIEQAELAAMACLSGKTVDKITALKAQDPTAYQQLQQTAAAFPSEFVETEMGLVPKGWEWLKIENIISRLKNKQKINKNNISDIGNIPVFEQGQNILMGYHSDNPAFIATPQDPIFIFGDHTCMTHISTKPFSIYQNVIPIKGKDIPTLWVYLAVKDKQKFQEYRRHWMEFIIKEICLPNRDLIEHFVELVTHLFEKKDAIYEQNKILRKVRDELLPKLLSGEIEL
ncbi:EcoKI restriction-modification system protein HsdS [Gallibacterium anatis UMN179]|uniref:EcoKI restriction-modification system protein HsdS n=1 Tax=Gallibacterium anatis (strain UMN179) TaxID=1005058 RepID=F4HDE0_GALAU|nr:restriction endonuclease subunit S [Gallibacterium anatis]AEC16678.1 EcoKI restriction-modification system protein HsdS [Gallibacterium anatis UMN179]